MVERILIVGFFVVFPAFGQWEPAVRFTQTSSAFIANTWTVSASFGGIVHVVWSDTSNNAAQIYYKRSQDHGKSWEDERVLTPPSSNALNAGVSIAGVMNPVTHIVWDDGRHEDREIYYKRSTDWGVNWSQDIRLTNAPGSSFTPTVHGCVCCGSNVRIVWVDERNGNGDIYYKYSADNGLTWSLDIPVAENKSPQLNPTLTFCRDLVQVVWADFRNGYGEIWGRRSTDCGRTWSDEACLSHQGPPSCNFPTIAHVDSSLHLFWVSVVDSSFDIIYRRTTDLGSTWEPEIRLIHQDVNEELPHLSCAAFGPIVHLTWVHPGKGIYYKRSLDSGSTWEEDTCIVPLPGAKVWNPSIAISGRCVHVVWCDDHEGNPEVYYKRNPTGNPIIPKD